MGDGKTGGQGSGMEGGREGTREVGTFALVFVSMPEQDFNLTFNLTFTAHVLLLFFLLSKLFLPHSWTLLIYFMP